MNAITISRNCYLPYTMTDKEYTVISIKDIFSTQINDDKSTKISMSSLLEMSLNEAMEVVNYLWKYKHVTISDITPEIRDIMDLSNRFYRQPKNVEN